MNIMKVNIPVCSFHLDLIRGQSWALAWAYIVDDLVARNVHGERRWQYRTAWDICMVFSITVLLFDLLYCCDCI